MKKRAINIYTFLALFTMNFSLLQAQDTITAISINSAITHGTAGNISVTYSIGEISGLIQKPIGAVAIGSLHCFTCQPKPPTSIDKALQLTAEQIKLYPNPTESLVHLETTVPQRLEFMVWGLDGRFYQGGQFRGETEIDLTHMASGLYMILLYDPEGQQVYQAKITKY